MASLATGESIFKYYPESWTPIKSDIGKRVRVKWKNDANEYDTYKGVIQNVSGKKIKKKSGGSKGKCGSGSAKGK